MILIGKAGRTIGSLTGSFAAFAVCLRPGAGITVTITASAAAAAPSATSAPTSRSPVRIAVTVSGRFLPIATVIVANCLQGHAATVRRFIQPFIQPFIPELVKPAVIPRGSGPATGWLFLAGPRGKRPVTTFFTTSAAPATASATASSTTALALLVFTATPWRGIGFAAVTRVSLGSINDGTQTAGLFTAFAIAPFTP